MILEDERCRQEDINESIVIFNPLYEKVSLCSFLALEDRIHSKLSVCIYKKFEKAIKKAASNTSLIDKYTFFKWDNLYNIISSTSFSRNIISFILSNDSKRGQVKLDYPLYNYLIKMKDNTIFGIEINDSEITFFKKIFEDEIINVFKEVFKEDIIIPDNSNKSPKLYILIKFFQMIAKNNFSQKCKDLNENINNLNQYVNDELDTNTLKYLDQMQKNDNEAYENELQIRKKSSSNWLLLKDNTVEQNLITQQVEVGIEELKQININKYMKQIDSFIMNELVKDFKLNYESIKNNQEWSEIFYFQNLVLNILNEDNTSLWFDTRIEKYCFRSKNGGNIINKNRDQISELLTRALKDKITKFLNQNSGFISNYAIEIVLVHKIKGINTQKININEKASNVIKILLFENAISSIDDDIFDTQSPLEFRIYDNDLFYTQNRFISTKYLIKRFNNDTISSNNQVNYKNLFYKEEDGYLLKPKNYSRKKIQSTSFIQQFIFYLVKEDYNIYYYVMNWLAYFFNSLKKNGIALVFIGDQEVTQNILWDKIIKEIFGLQYCITINDEECKTGSSFSIAKDKLFFHIGDILNPSSQFNDNTLDKIIKELLVKPSVTKVDENNELMENLIHGQMIITAKNPFPYIKRAMSKCTIIKVNDMDTIIEKLEIPDEITLEDKIQKDLDNFTDNLRSLEIDNSIAQFALNTKDREIVKNNKSSNIDKDDIDNKIDTFIEAIKSKDLDYFKKVKDIKDTTIYEHLKNAFDKDDGYFIGQDLLHYYNAIDEEQFVNKKQLMDKLKEKDKMFTQEVKTLKVLTKDKKEEVLFQAFKTSKEIGNKELYKIVGYKIAKNITIPHGAIIISSQDNIKKYNHDDINNDIKIHQEYQENKSKEKAKG